MSKLIAKSYGKIRARDALLGYWWYEKSEADKVIAHQKYKRCLVIAEMCCEKKDNCYNRALRKYTKDEADYLVRKSEFWQDWEFRWLALAEKFKEGV